MGIRIEMAIDTAVEIAMDNTFGYSNKWPDNLFGTGADPKNGDCGAFITYCWQKAGVLPDGQYFEPIGDSMNYNLYNETLLTLNGFSKIKFTSETELIRGDILVSGGHTAMYLGNDSVVHARNDYDGKSGDSSGNEICIQPYFDNNWAYVYRYKTELCNLGLWELYRNEGTFQIVIALQTLVNGIIERYSLSCEKLVLDGQFGGYTETAVKLVQKKLGLVVDGVVGNYTWAKLLGVD